MRTVRVMVLCVVLSALSLSDETALFASVVGVAKDDMLNVRSHPHYKSPKVAQIPPQWHVGIQKCQTVKQSKWCRIYPLVQQWSEEFGAGDTGWVNARYLKFYNRGYVVVQDKKSCDYALRCQDGRCEVVVDYSIYNGDVTALKTKWIERASLRAESHFGATPEGLDGYCNSEIFIKAYQKRKK